MRTRPSSDSPTTASSSPAEPDVRQDRAIRRAAPHGIRRGVRTTIAARGSSRIRAACSGVLVATSIAASGIGAEQTIDDDFHTAGVITVDLDGDGRLDIVAAGFYEDRFVWYRNLGEGEWAPQTIFEVNGAATIRAADIDQDGDQDLFGVARPEDTVYWFEQRAAEGGGAITFVAHHVLTIPGERPTSMDAADVDGDGDLDLLVAPLYAPHVYVLENTDGTGQAFGEVVRTIDVPGNGVGWVRGRDFDGDGDADLVVGTPWDWVDDTNYSWFRNDGSGGFEAPIRIGGGLALQAAFTADIADVDGDGWLDVVAMSSSAQQNRTVHWFRRLDAAGALWSDAIVIDDLFFGSDGEQSLRATDVNGDGHVDVVAGSTAVDPRIRVWINRGGGEAFCPIELAPGFAANGVAVGDLDGDGDDEVVAGSWAYYTGAIRAWDLPEPHPCLVCRSDIDHDGETGMSDLLRVLSAWGTDVAGHHADLDDDGVVGTGDVIIVLATWGPCTP